VKAYQFVAVVALLASAVEQVSAEEQASADKVFALVLVVVLLVFVESPAGPLMLEEVCMLDVEE